MGVWRGEQEQIRGSIERHGNISTIQTVDGTYSIVYGIHAGEEKKEIYPKGIDAACFEWADAYPKTHEEVERVSLTNQKTLLDFARHHDLPLFYTDCSLSPITLAEELVGPTEFIFAAYLLYKMRQETTRRSFLRSLALGGAATYLSLPCLSQFIRMGSVSAGIGEEQTVGMSQTVHALHPEYKTITLGLRDFVTAQKLQFLMKRYGYRHVLVARGAEHVDIETAILSQENKRSALLKQIASVLPIVLQDKESFYTIVEYGVMENGQWRIKNTIEEPVLKNILG